MKHITSAKNPQVKEWKKLLTKKERDKTETFLIEGIHLVEEALKADKVLEIIISEQSHFIQKINFGDTPVTTVTEEIIKTLSDTESPQGVFAVCEQEKINLNEITGKTFLLLDAVQDPGNLGTMIRTADAAGVDVVVVGQGSVDHYNPKVLRSAQGSHFHLPVLKGDLSEWVEKLKDEGTPVYGTALENGQVYTETTPSPTFALLVGNEGNGVNKELLDQTTKNLYIPIHGKSESLNVAVAAGILLYYLRA
ncbi:RNA methyltransferase (plasmid) [Bacillus sp. 31A1R]|uniref:RNA methyltransferase n=1 Tax=Robertmurraya mangrovi TaxID=3098077 RepID=A0ABU5IUB3_9BACI|nr:RNA methyltransferase [Bacillus sp. 31A1R]MDZ5470738.1 RNA methyltransferase [Bacillus sp. 31A1R]